jgi:hypothetical protein
MHCIFRETNALLKFFPDEWMDRFRPKKTVRIVILCLNISELGIFFQVYLYCCHRPFARIGNLRLNLSFFYEFLLNLSSFLNGMEKDAPMQLNIGKFSYNGRCGYLLKPEAMRRVGLNRSFDPFSEKPITNIVAQTVTIQLLSGIFMFEKKRPSCVTIELYGLPVDTFKGTRAFKAKVESYRAFNVFFSNTDAVYRFGKVS